MGKAAVDKSKGKKKVIKKSPAKKEPAENSVKKTKSGNVITDHGKGHSTVHSKKRRDVVVHL